MSTLKTFLRTAFNTIVPRTFYKPLFKQGDFIIPKDAFDCRFDLPRFEGDTLYSINSGSEFKIDYISHGYYRKDLGDIRGAVFVHDKLSGSPHYELSDLNEKNFFDNHTRKHILPGSRIHVPVDIVELNFEKI